jgi:hypothetical protein
MAASEVKIANVALTLLSSSRIMALDEDSENARKVNAIWEFERDELLECHNWNFAKTQAELALLSTTPTIDWYYSFQLPTDCVRFVRLHNDEAAQVYGNKLYTNQDSAKIEYVKRVTDASQFSPGFSMALAFRLARSLAYGITQSTSVAQMMDAGYTKKLQEAKASDAQAGTPQAPIRSTAMSARNG